MNPTISVIISTYNRAPLLKRAISSVLVQTFQNFELIIVNNASVDNTEEVVQFFDDSRIRYVCHDKNKGGPAARNTGIKLAVGKYFAFLDDDDKWLPKKLSKQVKKMDASSEKVGLVYVGTEIVDNKTQKTLRSYEPQFKGNVYKYLLVRTILGSVSSVLIRKECFGKVGLFDEELSSCQDWDMWLRISQEYEFDFVPEFLVKIYMHDVQISNNLAALIPGRTRMVQKHKDKFLQYPEIYVIHLKRLGKLHCLNGTWKEAASWFKKAVSVRFIEVFKILAWCILELPRIKFFSKEKNFKKYQI
ncbi:hypothetical protein MNBD_UNCLBAC01-2037 [hydrothermal vent metagenome]|uniref:Glycosyltransferase 2-like domain-containing protein n=1 Tax=hydrothermal vent metagenome TaxID=652676 RepID=A0A3B1DT18_9ZZZZ